MAAPIPFGSKPIAAPSGAIPFGSKPVAPVKAPAAPMPGAPKPNPNASIGIGQNNVPLGQSPIVQQVKGAWQGGVQRANEGAAETRAATTPLSKLMGFLKFGAGVVQAVSAPTAPIYSPVSPVIEKTADKLSDTPLLKGYGRDTASLPANEKTGPEKILEPLENAGIVAGGILGAKVTVPRVGNALGGAIDNTISAVKNTASQIKTAANTPKPPTPSPLVSKRITELSRLEANNAPIRKVLEKHRSQGVDSKKILAETDLLHGAVDDTGTIRTTNARSELNQFIRPQEKVISDTLVREGVSLRPKQVETYLRNTIDDSGLEGAALEAAHSKIDAEIKGLMRRADGSGNIPLAKVHDAKVNKYETIDYLNPSSKAADKAIARGLKELVAKNTKSADVNALNGELKAHYSVLNLLEKLDGKKVDGGKLGKYFAQTIGAVVGSHFGPLGAIAGAEVAGMVKGAALSQKMSGKTGAVLKQSPAMQSAITKSKAPPLALPAPKPGAPKVQNNVAVPLKSGPVPDELPAPGYRSNSSGNLNQSQTPTTAAVKTANTIKESLPQKSPTPLGAPKSVPSPKPTTLMDKAKNALGTIKREGQKGFVKNPFAKGKEPNIHQEDLAIMSDYTDYAAGTYKPRPSDAHQLELDATRIWEKYLPDIKMPKTNKAIANQFGVVLEKKGFLAEQPRTPLGRFDNKKKVGSAPLGTTKPNTANSASKPASAKTGAWPTTASKPSKAGSTSTGSAPTGKEGVSVQSRGTSGPFEGGLAAWKKDSFWGTSIKADASETTVPLSDIGEGKRIGVRQSATTDKGVAEWVERIKNGERPAVLVGNRPMGQHEITVLDGNHRLEAYRQLGIKEIPIVDNTGGKLSSPSIPKELEPKSLVDKAKEVFKSIKTQGNRGFVKIPEWAKDELGTKVAQKHFPEFDVSDADAGYFNIRKDGVGAISARVDPAYDGIVPPISVEKFGQRTKLFSGKDAVSRARKYLGLDK